MKSVLSVYLRPIIAATMMMILSSRGWAINPADGNALLMQAQIQQSQGHFETAGALYGKAAEAFRGEGKSPQQSQALKQSALMYEKEADKLLKIKTPSQRLNPVAPTKKNSNRSPSHAQQKNKQLLPPKSRDNFPNKSTASGAPTTETIEALIAQIYEKKRSFGPVVSVSFQSVQMIRGAHHGQEYKDGDIALASTVYTYNVKFAVRKDYSTQYESYRQDSNYALYLFHGKWDISGVAGGTGVGKVKTFNK